MKKFLMFINKDNIHKVEHENIKLTMKSYQS